MINVKIRYKIYPTVSGGKKAWGLEIDIDSNKYLLTPTVCGRNIGLLEIKEHKIFNTKRDAKKFLRACIRRARRAKAKTEKFLSQDTVEGEVEI